MTDKRAVNRMTEWIRVEGEVTLHHQGIVAKEMSLHVAGSGEPDQRFCDGMANVGDGGNGVLSKAPKCLSHQGDTLSKMSSRLGGRRQVCVTHQLVVCDQWRGRPQQW